jgi:hypothetical protein
MADIWAAFPDADATPAPKDEAWAAFPDAPDEPKKSDPWASFPDAPAEKVPDLDEQVRQYEEDNPLLTRAGQRLKAGALNAGAGLSATIASKEAETKRVLSPYFDRIDQGEALTAILPQTASGQVDPDLGLAPGDIDTLRRYYGNADERQQTRADYDASIAQQVGNAATMSAESAAIARNPAVAAFSRAMNDKRYGDAAKIMATNPVGIIAQVGTESLPTMLPAMAVAIVNPALGAAAMGGTSATQEYGSSILDYLGDHGVNTQNPAAIQKALSDPAILEGAKQYAGTRAVVIGGVDALSGGLATKTLVPKLIGNSVVREGVNELVAQPIAQAAMGAGGEAAAQLATKGEISDPASVALEAAGEAFSAPVEAATFGADRMRGGAEPVPVRPPAGQPVPVRIEPTVGMPGAGAAGADPAGRLEPQINPTIAAAAAQPETIAAAPPQPDPRVKAAADFKALMADDRPLEEIVAEKRAEDKAAEVQASLPAGFQAAPTDTGIAVTAPDGSTVAEGSDPLDLLAAATKKAEFPRGTGERTDPVKVEQPGDVDTAAAQANPEPTPAQKEAGNYKLGHLRWHGMDIAIETAKGGERVAADGSWAVPDFPAHYGYLKATKAADGDAIDIYVGENPQAPKVYVFDQIDPATGKFDETKSFLGFNSEAEAREVYNRAFSDGSGPTRVGAVTEMSVGQFKNWARGPKAKKAVRYQAPTAAQAVVEAQPPVAAVAPAAPGAGAAPRARASKELSVAQMQLAGAREVMQGRRLDQLSVPERKELAARIGVTNEGNDARMVKRLAEIGYQSGNATVLDQRGPNAPSKDRRRAGIPDRASKPVFSYVNDNPLKSHADYKAAKAGDAQAAIRLVADRVKPETVGEVANRFGSGVVFAPVTALEASGQNAIPGALASYYAAAVGARTDTSIVQANRAGHTGEKAMARLVSRPLFDGPVQAGAKYVLVDDVSVLGGTLAEMANHIQSGGGEVVGVVTLVNAGRHGQYRANRGHIAEIERRFGNEIRSLGVEPSALTANEALYVLNYPDADALRASIAKAQSQRRGRAGEEGIRPSEAKERRVSDGTSPDTDKGSRDRAIGALPATVTPDLVAAFLAEQAAVLRELRAMAKKLFGAKANVETLDVAEYPHATGRFVTTERDGALQHVIQIALADTSGAPRSPQEMIGTLLHEGGVHYLRALGVLNGQRWRILKAQAKAWRKQFDIDARYAHYSERFKGAELEAALDEEAIAEAITEYKFGRRFQPGIDAIMDVVWRFVDRVKSLLAGHGFKSWKDVFEEIGSGKLAGEADTAVAGHRGEQALEQRRKPTDDANAFGGSIAAPHPGVMEGLLDSNRSLIDRLKGSVNPGSLTASLDNFRTAVQDRFLPLLRIQQQIEKARGESIPDEQNAYVVEEGFSGRAGERLQRLELDFKKPLLEAVVKSGLTVARIEEYLYARHAAERNAAIATINPKLPDGGSGMTNFEAGQILERAERDGIKSTLDEIAKLHDAIHKETMRLRVEYGLLSKEDAAKWQAIYEHYTPLRGFADIAENEVSGHPNQGQGYSVKGPESKRALGRESRAADLLAHTLMQAEEAIIRGEKNRVGQALLALVEANPDPAYWESNPVETKRRINPDTGQVEDYSAIDRDDPNTLIVKRDGKQQRIRIADERLAANLKNLDADKVGIVIRALMRVNRFLSMVNTGLNPEFLITNAFRDIQAGLVNLAQFDKKGLIASTLKDYPKALKAGWGGVKGKADTEWQRHFREYAAAGGKVNFFKIDDVNEQRANLQRELDAMAGKGSTPQKIMRGLRAVLDFVENANQAVDNAIRLSAFVNARRRGMTAQQAASLAKNLTVNFNRRGEIGPQLNALYLFFNASMQGTAVLANAVKSRKVRRLVYAMIAAGFAGELLNAMLSPDDDDGERKYDKISDFDKSRNIIVMLPEGAPVPYVKIPMPYGYNALYDFGRNLGSLARGAQTGSATLGNIASTFADAFNPIGGTESWLNLISPTLIDPVVDLAQNEDYAGRPIMPEQPQYGTPIPDSQRYWGSVNPLLRVVADKLNEMTGGNHFKSGAIDVSPETLEHFSTFVGGAAGSFLKRTFVDLPAKIVAGEAIEANDIPFVRKVAGEIQESADIGDFYDRAEEIEAAHEEIKGLREEGRADEANEAQADSRDLLSLRSLASSVRKQLKSIRKSIAAVSEMPAIDAAERRKRLDDLAKLRKAAIDTFNRAYVERVKKPKQRDRALVPVE